jgi:hypothetical protein
MTLLQFDRVDNIGEQLIAIGHKSGLLLPFSEELAELEFDTNRRKTQANLVRAISHSILHVSRKN